MSMLHELGRDFESGAEDVVSGVEDVVKDVVSGVEDAGEAVMSLDWMEVVKRVLKYLILGVAVSLVAYWLPMNKRRMPLNNVLMLGVSAAAAFVVLDTFAPSVGMAARSGAGLAIGAGLGGGLPMARM